MLLESLDCNAKAEKTLCELTAHELNTNDKYRWWWYGYINWNYKRNDDEDISGYIIEYEHLHKQIIDFDMKLLDPVSTFKLIDGANLLDDDKKLALTIDNDMKFENMKSALKWLLSKTKSLYNNQADRQLRIKEAETYFTKNKYKGKQYGKYSQNNKKLNPPNKIDKVIPLSYLWFKYAE